MYDIPPDHIILATDQSAFVLNYPLWVLDKGASTTVTNMKYLVRIQTQDPIPRLGANALYHESEATDADG